MGSLTFQTMWKKTMWWPPTGEACCSTSKYCRKLASFEHFSVDKQPGNHFTKQPLSKQPPWGVRSYGCPVSPITLPTKISGVLPSGGMKHGRKIPPFTGDFASYKFPLIWFIWDVPESKGNWAQVFRYSPPERGRDRRSKSLAKWSHQKARRPKKAQMLRHVSF